MPLTLERHWAILWELAQRSDDDIIRAADARVNLMPFLRDLGYPVWFLETIVNFLRGVLSTGRAYTLEEMVRLLELTYGISPASPVPRS
jgi:hypothetical protein